MFLCGITLGCIRFYGIIISFFLHRIIMNIILCCADLNKPQSRFRRFFAYYVTKLTIRLILFNYGYLWISLKRHKIKDYDEDYPVVKKEDEKEPVIIISNHTS